MDKDLVSTIKESNIHYLNFGNQTNPKIEKITEIETAIKAINPNIPVYFLRPNAIKNSVEFFKKNFVSKNETEILYSVKSNPEPAILKYLFKNGITHFDVASINEVKLINNLFKDDAKMYYMHPIKPYESIVEAYHKFGIRTFSLDTIDELNKIIKATKNAKDLNLCVRLAIPHGHAAIDLSGKFGILPSESVNLIRKTRAVARNLGICFHVGSQCMDPLEYRHAITIAKETIQRAKVKIDILDIGGGFPSSYPGMMPKPLKNYFDEIFSAIEYNNFGKKCKIWCEPGRALVAEASSLMVRVEARKGNMLYINDGTYGGLFDAGHPGFVYPTKTMRINKKSKLSNETEAFGFYGPTCDSMDTMKGPFYLPKNIQAGDYIEIGQLGAYSRSIRTNFNGFNENLLIEVSDEPLISMFTNIESSYIKYKSNIA